MFSIPLQSEWLPQQTGDPSRLHCISAAIAFPTVDSHCEREEGQLPNVVIWRLLVCPGPRMMKVTVVGKVKTRQNYGAVIDS